MNAVQIQTRVLPGKRVEVETPELAEGELVNVQVTPAEAGPDLRHEPYEEWLKRFNKWANKPRRSVGLKPEALRRESFYESEP